MDRRVAAIVELLSREDPPDLVGRRHGVPVRRGHYRTLDGKPEAQARLLRTQPVVYVQYQQLAKER